MTESNLSEEYKKAVRNLMAASKAIDETKGMKNVGAKLDFLIAQNNVLSIQIMMILEGQKKEESDERGQDN